jgi:hypothetical protein
MEPDGRDDRKDITSSPESRAGTTQYGSNTSFAKEFEYFVYSI